MTLPSESQNFDSRLCHLGIDNLIARCGVGGDQSWIDLTLESDFSRLLGWNVVGPPQLLVYVAAELCSSNIRQPSRGSSASHFIPF